MERLNLQINYFPVWLSPGNFLIRINRDYWYERAFEKNCFQFPEKLRVKIGKRTAKIADWFLSKFQVKDEYVMQQ